MTKLTYTWCACIKRGDCILPGTRGHLYAVIKGREIPLQRCRYCRDKPQP